MCGIIGITGQGHVTERLLDGLKRLEYRGYDSSGIAILTDGTLDKRRAKGKIRNLEAKITNNPLEGQTGIAHTRWATHGVPNEANAHPHQSGRVAVVHNGIIENYLELREALSGEREFQSDTDTEVVAHLVDIELNKGLSPREAFAKTLKILKGAYAFGLIIDNNPYEIFDETDRAVTREVTTIKGGPTLTEKGIYPHYMLKEIYEQPDIISQTLVQYLDGHMTRPVKSQDLAPALDFTKFDRVILIACGTAYYAGNVMTSTMAREADVAMPIHAGPEIGVASTKAFTAQLTALAALSLSAAQGRETISDEVSFRVLSGSRRASAHCF